MNTSVPAPATRPRLRLRLRPRGTALFLAAAASAVGLLLAGCSTGSSSAISAIGSHAAGSPGSPGLGAQLGVAAPDARAASGSTSVATARLVVPGQSIIYTAALTVRAENVSTAAALATSIVTAAGGYVAGEQATLKPTGHARATVSLRLKVPVATYPATLRQLSGKLGSQTSLSQQTQDVTGEVADVNSRVASAHAAIAALRTLLRRAASVNGLLNVQDQISSQESELEALQAQQRALAGETSYATVSLRLVSKHLESVPAKKRSHGFAGGLSAGWRGLRVAGGWLLTAVGTVLPFAVLAAVLAGIGYAGRRRLLRRRSRPSTAG
jgi:hypothetical protein